MGKTARLTGYAALCGLFLAAAFGAGFYTREITAGASTAWTLSGLGPAHSYPLLHEVRALLQARYIGTLPDEKTLEYGAVRGFVAALNDPYTVFVEPQVHELESQSLQGEYGGIGATLTKADDGTIVLSPFPESPAARGGLLAGDVLLAVDEIVLTPETTLDQATALVRGPIDTTVTLKVRHTTGEELTATLRRERIEIPTVTWKIAQTEPLTIGQITISHFSGRTAQELKRAADELAAAGATHYILDLRNNGGGILEAGVDVAGQFLDGGVVIYETQRDAPEKVYSVPSNAGPLATAPLAVLVNHNTASAAEIVAGALLDRNRAPLIGQTTFGKGSVQLVYDLSDGSSLHVTAYLWYTPSRRQLDQNGLPPTIPVAPATDGSDPELARAIEYLSGSPQASP